MPTILALLIQAFLPVAVDEVKKKLADKDPTNYPTPQDVPTREVAVPALQQVAAGAVVSKTAWFSLALGVFGLLEQNQGLISQYVPPQYMGLVIAGIGAVSFFLRGLTTNSLTEKAQPKE